MADVPTPSLENILYLMIGFLAGLPAPYWYAQERMRGFSRWVLDKIPYNPPPGKEEGEALEEAVNEDSDDEEEENGTE